MNTIQLLTREVISNKMTLDILHYKLPNIIDINEKNEYIFKIEEIQNENIDYLKAIDILNNIENE